MSSTDAVTLPRQGSGTSSLARSRRPSAPKRSVTGQARPKLIEVEWTRFLSADLCLVHPEAGEFALTAHPRVREPDRRHQVAPRERREDQRVGLVGLAGKRREALDLLGIGDLDVRAPCSSVSCTSRTPVIDSTMAQT